MHELLSIAKINEVNDFWIPKNIRKDESTRKSFWIISIFSTSFGINKTLIARITLIVLTITSTITITFLDHEKN